MIPTPIEDKLRAFFLEKGSPAFGINNALPLAGGDINQAYRLETNQGEYFIKYNQAEAFPGMFETEAQGLLKLREAGEIRVPEPVFAGIAGEYSFLLMEYIWQGNYGVDFWTDFGSNLARLHRHTSRMFGLSYDNYIGSLRQSNLQHEDWISFFIQERLEKQVQLGLDSGNLSRILMKKFDQLYARLPELIPEEPPALLHGDLWSGNFITDPEGKACLIDPSVYFGHREIDLAMTRLFGGFSASFYDAYNEEFRLEGGWRERLEIHNLYPLLVHVNLFKGSYIQSVETILKRY